MSDYTAMRTKQDTARCFAEGLITEEEMMAAFRKLVDDRAVRYVKHWHSHLTECFEINWQFPHGSEASKDVTTAVNTLKVLVKRASKNLK